MTSPSAIPSDGRPWRREADGISLAVRVTPRGGRDAVEGIERLDDGRVVLKLRVRAAATEGEANAATVALVAAALGMPRRDVSLAAGAKARIKLLRLAGDPDLLAARAAELGGADRGPAA